MVEEVYKDYIPANARVFVDYNAKEKVKFSFPSNYTYRQAVWKFGYRTILSFWFSIHASYQIILPIAIVVFFVYLFFNPIEFTTQATQAKTTILSLKDFLLPTMFFSVYLFGLPALFNLILSLKKEWYSKVIPKLGYYSSMILNGAKQKSFTTEDINQDNKATIPTFSNVYLDYKCTGDFNKYLEKIEIFEIPFEFYERRFFFFWLKKKSNNEFHFRASFEFSKKPIKGNMVVTWV